MIFRKSIPPDAVVSVGNVRARVWVNPGVNGRDPEVKIDVGVAYSNRGNNPDGSSGLSHSIPVNVVPDACKALKRAYKLAIC